MIIEKIVLKVGKKKIELTQAEYEELKQHFTDKEWVPYSVYPYPYQQWPDTSPIITWTSGATGSAAITEYVAA